MYVCMYVYMNEINEIHITVINIFTNINLFKLIYKPIKIHS